MTPPRSVPAHLLVAPFRAADALSLGVSRDTLRGPLFRSPFRGVRVAAALEDSVALRAAAALLALPPGSSLSCHTAAELRSIPVPMEPLVHAHIPRDGPDARVMGIDIHRREVRSVTVRSLPVCPTGVMFVDLAEYLSLIQLVIVGDALLRRSQATIADLRTAVDASAGRRGVQHARRAIQLVRPRVDSPMETTVRLLVVLAGLPCPETGYRVIEEGQLVGWVDLAFPQWRLIIEYDGDLHRTLKSKWRMDVATREELRHHGWTVIVLTWDDCAARPTRTLHRIGVELKRNGYPHVPASRRFDPVRRTDLSAEWQQAFPGTAAEKWNW